MRSTEFVITFRRPFSLASLDALQPAGTYRLVVDEVEIDGLSFVAYRRVATMLHLPAIGVAAAMHQVYLVDPHDLERAMAADELDESKRI